MLGRALKAAPVSIMILAAAGLLAPSRLGIASGEHGSLPRVSGISIHQAPGGAVVIDVATTRPVHYRTLELSSPRRLVVDLNDASRGHLRSVYPAQSPLLERVRVSQWKSDPPIVRVVADLEGTPAFSVHARPSGVRIELKPRAERSRGRRAQPGHNQRAANLGGETSEVAPRRAAAKSPFTVHQFADLSASLTDPVIPPRDRLVPVTQPVPAPSSPRQSAALALVSGISIRPATDGGTDIAIASSHSVPYRVFQLADPFRLVVDLRDARDGSRQEVYPVNSPVLKRVRVGQWRSDDHSVVRVVADLVGFPIFDVYARQPGIRIDLRPRRQPGLLTRNPFEFATGHPNVQLASPAARTDQAMTATPNSPPPGAYFSDLKAIGYLEKQGSQTQAIISDRSSIYFVAQGGTIEKRFRVLSISSEAVEVQDIQTLKTNWLAYGH